MLKLLSSAASFFTGGWQGCLVAAGIGAAISGGGVWYVTHNIEKGWRTELQLADAKFETNAVKAQADHDAAQSKVNVKAASDEAFFQGKLAGQVALNIQETPIYVTAAQDSHACVTVGFYRVLRAADLGTSADKVSLAPGQSDDDCADYAESALAGTLEKVIGIGHQNAEQLNSLEQNVRDLAAVPTH